MTRRTLAQHVEEMALPILTEEKHNYISQKTRNSVPKTSDQSFHQQKPSGQMVYNGDTCNINATKINHMKDDKKTRSKRDKHSGRAAKTKRIIFKPYSCTLCDKAFTRHNNLMIHLNIHSGERPYDCKICLERFPRPYDFKRHQCPANETSPLPTSLMFGKTSDPKSPAVRLDIQKEQALHCCPKCVKVFLTPDKLNSHLETHLLKRPFGCEQCGKRFSQSSHLKRHLQSHSERKMHACSLCGKSFTQPQSLKAHHRIHTGDRPFRCDLCGKTFVHSGNLRVHARVHTGERPHVCPHCAKDFTFSGDLQRHIKIHTREKPHVCPQCDKKYSRSDHLKRHQSTSHGWL